MLFASVVVAEGRSNRPPSGLSLADWAQIRGEYERHRHGMFPDGTGGYRARSPYQGWLARFDGRRTSVQPYLPRAIDRTNREPRLRPDLVRVGNQLGDPLVARLG